MPATWDLNRRYREAMTNHDNIRSRALRLLISIFFFAGIRVRQAFSQMLGGTPTATCIVLYYHSIASEYRKVFAKQMDMVLRFTNPIDPEHLPPLLPGRHYSVITFDDGFQDAVENAVPELVSRGIHAMFFVTAGALGNTADWWPVANLEHARRIATAEHLRLMPSKLISVGAHTVTHPHLSTLDESHVKHEILESRRQLESLLGQKVRSLSFPFGDFDDKVVQWSREAGYERAFTTEHRKAFENPESFLVGRVKAEPTDWPLEFRLKILGGYVWLPYAVALKRWLRIIVTRRFRRLDQSVSSPS
jgi:peptidoglycan/xylan/chitin deacetylase (PgdA/CDA1 family)